MKQILIVLLVGMINLLSFTSKATLIDFETLQHNDDLVDYHGSLYIDSGYQFEQLGPNSNGFGTFGIQEARFTGSTALFNANVDGTTQLTKVGGGLFDLISIDLAELNGPRVANITFIRDGGHSQTFTLDGNAFSAETFFFDAGFLGSTSVTWAQNFPFHQFDNIVIDAPEPSLIALLGLGLLGIGFSRKKRLN